MKALKCKTLSVELVHTYTLYSKQCNLTYPNLSYLTILIIRLRYQEGILVKLHDTCIKKFHALHAVVAMFYFFKENILCIVLTLDTKHIITCILCNVCYSSRSDIFIYPTVRRISEVPLYKRHLR